MIGGYTCLVHIKKDTQVRNGSNLRSMFIDIYMCF